MLKNQSGHLLEFIKDKTREKIVDMDGKYNIKEKATKLAAATRARVLSVDKQYNISKKITDTKHETNIFLKRWGIDVKSIFNNVLNKASHYDTTLTGGFGKNVFLRAKQTAKDVTNAIHQQTPETTPEE